MPALAIAANHISTEALGQDWSNDHRVLLDADRAQAVGYIRAIAHAQAVKVGADPTAEAAIGLELWHTYRMAFDGMRGPYQRQPHEDAKKALMLL